MTHGLMYQQHPTLREELRDRRRRLGDQLSRRYGVSVRLYKLGKVALQMLGAGAGVYAMWLGADPMTVFGLIAAIIAGPELFEELLTNGE